jgi:hypothetical protein
MMHYGPQDNTYVYFRYHEGKKVMVAFNHNPKAAILEIGRFHEMLSGVASGVDVLSGKTYDLRTELTLGPRSVVVLEL